MKRTSLIYTIIFFCIITSVHAQKIISDCTIQYVLSRAEPDSHYIGTKTLYVKGKNLRVDLVTKAFNQTIFYDNNTGNFAVLKQIGDAKYISQYDSDEWDKENKIFNGLSVSLTGETKNILGYNCNQAIITLQDERKYIVYYVPELIPSIAEMPFNVKNIPGLVLAYQSTLKNGNDITYTAQKIDFKPVPIHQFDVPQQGYRILQK